MRKVVIEQKTTSIVSIKNAKEYKFYAGFNNEYLNMLAKDADGYWTVVCINSPDTEYVDLEFISESNSFKEMLFSFIRAMEKYGESVYEFESFEELMEFAQERS